MHHSGAPCTTSVHWLLRHIRGRSLDKHATRAVALEPDFSLVLQNHPIRHTKFSLACVILRRKAILPFVPKPTMWKTSLPTSMPIEAKGAVVESMG
jgi:hypothetical protein